MIAAPSSSSSCCFCWNVVSQPSVSPLCDLINECWATRLDPLWGGHIWTLYRNTYLSLSLSLILILFRLSLSHSHNPHFSCHVANYISPALSCHSPSSHRTSHFLVLFCLSRPLSNFFFNVLPFVSASPPSLLSPPSFLHEGQALLSSYLPQELLTSAGCGAKVVPLSLPAGSGCCLECNNERRGEGRRGGKWLMTRTWASLQDYSYCCKTLF